MADQPGDRRLAVRAGDRHDRHPPVRVADPGRRGGPGVLEPVGPARDAAAPGRRSVRVRRTGRRPARPGRGPPRRSSAPAPRRSSRTYDPVPGVRRAMDGDAAAALAVVGRSRRIQPTTASIGSGQLARRHGRAETDERMPSRVAHPVPRPPPTDRDLDLDHRLEPVDIRALEQADLDQSHGPGRIRERGARRPADRRRRPVDCGQACRPDRPTSSTPSSSALEAAIRAAELPAFLADLERLVNIDCGSYTPAGRRRGRAFVGAFMTDAGAHVEVRPDPAARAARR